MFSFETLSSIHCGHMILVNLLYSYVKQDGHIDRYRHSVLVALRTSSCRSSEGFVNSFVVFPDLLNREHCHLIRNVTRCVPIAGFADRRLLTSVLVNIILSSTPPLRQSAISKDAVDAQSEVIIFPFEKTQTEASLRKFSAAPHNETLSWNTCQGQY